MPPAGTTDAPTELRIAVPLNPAGCCPTFSNIAAVARRAAWASGSREPEYELRLVPGASVR
jgi:hypothetical protein